MGIFGMFGIMFTPVFLFVIGVFVFIALATLYYVTFRGTGYLRFEMRGNK